MPRYALDSRATDAFVRHLDVERYARQGTDWFNPRYSIERLGLPLDEIDPDLTFDFAWTEEVERALHGVDRRHVLALIFEQVTAGRMSNTERHLAVLDFVQRASFHSGWMQPVYEDGSAVSDPLVLLELGLMRCGHVARLAIDLFDAAGYRGRLVQLGGHIIAEIFYDDDWHYLDADVFAGGAIARDADGSIPSITELSLEPDLLDALPSYTELSDEGGMPGSLPHPSWFYFSRYAYADDAQASFYERLPSAKRNDRYYGWMEYVTYVDRDRVLGFVWRRTQPGGVVFTDLEVGGIEGAHRTVRVAWTPAEDLDGDLLGYRLFVSARSRGWHYQHFIGPSELEPLWAGSGWSYRMYDALNAEPPHEIARIETPAASAELRLPEGGPYYLTVMPFDAHGEAVGKVRYVLSPEIVVRP